MNNPKTSASPQKEAVFSSTAHPIIPTDIEAYELSFTPVIHTPRTEPPQAAIVGSSSTSTELLPLDVIHFGLDGQPIRYHPTNHRTGSSWT